MEWESEGSLGGWSTRLQVLHFSRFVNQLKCDGDIWILSQSSGQTVRILSYLTRIWKRRSVVVIDAGK